MSLESLRPLIRRILSAPGIDLGTISAKRVRKQLPDLDASLSPEFLKANKDGIDDLTGRVFQEVSESRGVSFDADGAASGSGSGKRKRKVEAGGYGGAGGGDEAGASDGQSEGYESDGRDEEEEDEEEDVKPPKAKHAKGKKITEMTDEEFARQLSQEINTRERMSRTAAGSSSKLKSARPSKKGASRSPKKVKSAARVLSSGEESDGGQVAKPKKKKQKTGGGGAKGGFAKEFVLSQPLSVLIGEEKLSRPQVVKGLWAYIHAHDLQNPSNRKEILCDDKFRAVFNVDKIDMFKMNKVLSQHLHEE